MPKLPLAAIALTGLLSFGLAIADDQSSDARQGDCIGECNNGCQNVDAEDLETCTQKCADRCTGKESDDLG